jgi:hypothetical protein
MLKNSEKESKSTSELYDKTACSCRDNLRDWTREFEETQKEIDRQTINSKDLKAKSDELFTRIQKHVGVKEDMENAVAAKYADLKANTAEDQKAVNFIEETDSAMVDEISELGTINQPYLDGLIQGDTQTLASTRAKCNERLRKAEEMMAACDKVLAVLDGTQGKKIIDMVKALRQHAFDRKTAIQQGENECQSKIYDLEKSISSNTNFLTLSKTNSDRLEGEKGEVDGALAKTNADIAELIAARDTLKDDIQLTNQECKTAAADYDEHTALLTAEIAGLNGAIDALKKVPGPASAESFLQLSMGEANSDNADRSISAIAERATSLHSTRLATMALQLRLGKKGPDFFESVRSMIVTMVERLEDEQMAETSKTDWCEGTLATLRTGKKDSQVNHEAAVSAVRTSEGIIAEKTEIKEKTEGEKTEAENTLAEMKQLAADKGTMYTEQEAEKSGGEAALKEAISFLKEIYEGDASSARAAGPSAGTKTRATNGGGIITMLSGIQEDYGWDADVANMEMQCNKKDSYLPRGGADSVSCNDGVARKGTPGSVRASELFELQNNIDTKENDISLLEQKISGLDSEIKTEKGTLADNEESRDQKKGLLESAKDALKARQQACVNANDSFEARQKRRQEEISALKEALEILETHSKNAELGGPAPAFLATIKRAK